MAVETYARIQPWVKISEGGYVNDRNDLGRATNHGITQGTLSAIRGYDVSVEEVKALTYQEALQIYRQEYWVPIKGDQLPAGLDYAVYDFAVNSGVSRAVRFLQEIVGAKRDGVMGPFTLSAIRKCGKSVPEIIERLCEARWAYMKTLGSWKHFRIGWTTRVMGRRTGVQSDDIGVIDRAVMLATSTGEPIPDPKPYQGGKARCEDKKVLASWLTPDGITKGAMAASGLSGILAGSGPVQWACAIALVISVCVGGFLLIRNERMA